MAAWAWRNSIQTHLSVPTWAWGLMKISQFWSESSASLLPEFHGVMKHSISHRCYRWLLWCMDNFRGKQLCRDIITEVKHQTHRCMMGPTLGFIKLCRGNSPQVEGNHRIYMLYQSCYDVGKERIKMSVWTLDSYTFFWARIHICCSWFNFTLMSSNTASWLVTTRKDHCQNP